MRTFEKKTKEVHEIAQVHCNKCGVRCDFKVHKDHASIDVNWGYHSNKDMEKHCWDLCEDCYDSIVKTFVIPVDTFEYMFDGDVVPVGDQEEE